MAGEIWGMWICPPTAYLRLPIITWFKNDVIIVEPTKQKARMVDQQLAQQRLSLALSLITTATLIYSIFRD